MACLRVICLVSLTDFVSLYWFIHRCVCVVSCVEAADQSARAILASELEILKIVGAGGHPNILQLIGNSVEGGFDILLALLILQLELRFKLL